MTEAIWSVTGVSWLIGPSRPSVAPTAVMPSSSGRPAATSAPKATSRISPVSGSDSVSAFLKSSPSDSSNALSAEAEPICSTRRSGCEA
jgi:hypothetical protein